MQDGNLSFKLKRKRKKKPFKLCSLTHNRYFIKISTHCLHKKLHLKKTSLIISVLILKYFFQNKYS